MSKKIKTNWRAAGLKAWDTRRKNLAAKQQVATTQTTIGTRELRILLPANVKITLHIEGKLPVTF